MADMVQAIEDARMGGFNETFVARTASDFDPSAPRLSRDAVTVPPLTQAQLGYLGGLIDGEGHVGAARPSKGITHLTIGMTQQEPIEWLFDHVSGTVGFYDPDGCKRSGEWNLRRHADLAHLLPKLIPHLVLKRDEASLLLELVQHHRSAVEPGDRAAWREKSVELRTAIYEARHSRPYVYD